MFPTVPTTEIAVYNRIYTVRCLMVVGADVQCLVRVRRIVLPEACYREACKMFRCACSPHVSQSIVNACPVAPLSIECMLSRTQ
jgi:hypothetical protein